MMPRSREIVAPENRGPRLRSPGASELQLRAQNAPGQRQASRGQSAQGMRNAQVIDLTHHQAGPQYRSPTSNTSLSRMQTNLSDTQKMKANNPFRKERGLLDTQVVGTQETQENERLRTTLAHTQQRTTTQGGVLDFTRSAVGFTHRLLQAFTSPSPTAMGLSQRQGSPHNPGFNQPNTGRNLLGATSPSRFLGAFTSGQTVETQQSRLSMNRPVLRRQGSPQVTEPQLLTQPRALQTGAPGSVQQLQKRNIQRIIQNNILESDLERHAHLCSKNRVDFGQNPILEEETVQQRYDELDTKRATQLQQQTTERLMFEQKPSFRGRRMESEASDDQSYGAAGPESDSKGSQVPELAGDIIQQTLVLLQSQSPFKDLAQQSSHLTSHRGLSKTPIGLNLITLSSQDESEKFQERPSGAAFGSGSLEDLDIEVDQIVVKKQQSKGPSVIPSGSSTERQSMGAHRERLLSKTPSQAEQERQIPVIQERVEEEDENERVPTLDEKHKFFNLMTNQRPTLGQQVTAGMKKSRKRQNYKEQPSFIESSHPSTSYDSINPADLIVATTGNSNYASGVSSTPATANKYTKLQSVLHNGLYLQTRSSGYSSIYQATRGDEEGYDTDRRGAGAPPESGVDKCLAKIDENLNTFTTKQFEELRDKVKSMGYYKAQIIAQQQFGLKHAKTHTRDLQQSPDSEEKKETGLQSAHSPGIGLGLDPSKALLNRRLVLSNEEKSHTILCSGFLSSPSVLFDPYCSRPRHLATILDHRTDPPSLSQYLPLKLLSIKSLVALKRNCKMLSCGFEHCLALIDDSVWSWGYGGSGCLGHGDYKTVVEPQRVEGIESRVIYIEAGGYHNGVIAQSSRNGQTQVFVWGRGDVGQLGLSERETIKDPMGQVLLEPVELQFQLPIVQIALGDAHTLFLTNKGQVLSCGWHELGQIGISQDKHEQDQRNGIFIHRVEIIDEATSEKVKIKQITCGAVFSVALSVSGDVYAWGSNNNGQMALSTGTGSESSNSTSNKPSQLDFPTKMEIERENPHGAIRQVLAGDCHVLALDDESVYAWGQGQILEEDSKNDKFYQDVICNQPIQIEAGLENEMFYQVDRAGDSESSQTHAQKLLPSHEALRNQNLQDVVDDLLPHREDAPKQAKKAAKVPPLALNQMHKGGRDPFHPSLAANQTQSYGNATLNHLQVHSSSNPYENSHKTIKSKLFSSNDYDLETVKNTEDYNTFIKNASENKKTDSQSFKKFEMKLNHYMLRDSSESGNGAGTTGRETKERSAGGFSDLIPIIEESQGYRPQQELSSTQNLASIQMIEKIKMRKNEQHYSSTQNQVAAYTGPLQREDLGHLASEQPLITELIYSNSVATKQTQGSLSRVALSLASKEQLTRSNNDLLSQQFLSSSVERMEKQGPQQLGGDWAGQGKPQAQTREKHAGISQDGLPLLANRAGASTAANEGPGTKKVQVPPRGYRTQADNEGRRNPPVSGAKAAQNGLGSGQKPSSGAGQQIKQRAEFQVTRPGAQRGTLSQRKQEVPHRQPDSHKQGQVKGNSSARTRVQQPFATAQRGTKAVIGQAHYHSASKKDASGGQSQARSLRSKYNSANKAQQKEKGYSTAQPVVLYGASEHEHEEQEELKISDIQERLRISRQPSSEERMGQQNASSASGQGTQMFVQKVDGNPGATGQSIGYKYPQNVTSGGTGETGRSHGAEKPTHQHNNLSSRSSQLLSLRNKAEKVSRKPSPEQLAIRGLKGQIPGIVTNEKDQPVSINSRPESSGRSRSPKSPRTSQRASQRSLDYMKKSSRSNIPKSISSKNLPALKNQQFASAVHRKIQTNLDFTPLGLQVDLNKNPTEKNLRSQTSQNKAYQTLQDNIGSANKLGSQTIEHSLQSRSSLAHNQHVSREGSPLSNRS